ncbi:MAG: glycosyltransferase [Crocinitomicaceae bacterium]|nr:glycosyltransferase [Crocinitomicaceae bacterium]MBK8925258.1 glycosyltransferase [Crocinitomicaceae bacterium]
MGKRALVVLTVSFPFKGEEITWKDHLLELTKKFDLVIFFSLPPTTDLEIDPPENVIYFSEKGNPPKISFSILKRFVRILIYEILREKKFWLYVKKIRMLYAMVRYASHRADYLRQELNKIGCDYQLYFHSTWLNTSALSLAFLKTENIIDGYTFRINGYDFQDERQSSGHVFFRRFIFDHSTLLVGLSKFSIQYMQAKGFSVEKMFLNYGGKISKSLQLLRSNNVFTCVSCSGLISLKRVHLIAQALRFVDFELNWIHFGDGPQRQEIEKLADVLPKNISVRLAGHVDQQVIEQYYENNQINLFLHLSESEGLCMAIIEAQRYGIPAMACGVGGVKDIINESTGILLPLNISPEELAVRIVNFRNSKLNTNDFRQAVYSYFQVHFDVEKNTAEFINKLE